MKADLEYPLYAVWKRKRNSEEKGRWNQVLRLDWNLLFNIINLIILYALMKRFLFKPVNAILEKRQQEADARFVQADAQEAAAQEKAQKYDSLLEDAQNEKERIVAQAREEASAEYGRIVADAKDKADGIVEKAKTDAQAEKAAVMQQADAAVRDMVVTAAARMVAEKNGTSSDRALYDKFLSEAE